MGKKRTGESTWFKGKENYHSNSVFSVWATESTYIFSHWFKTPVPWGQFPQSKSEGKNGPFGTLFICLCLTLEVGLKSPGEVRGEEFVSFLEREVVLRFLEFYSILSGLGSLSIWQEAILWDRLHLVLCWCRRCLKQIQACFILMSSCYYFMFIFKRWPLPISFSTTRSGSLSMWLFPLNLRVYNTVVFNFFGNLKI